MSTAIGDQWILALIVLLAFVGLGYLVRILVLRRIAEMFVRTETDLDDLLLESIRGHVPFWSLLAGWVLAARIAPVTPHLSDLAGRAAAVLLMLSLSIAAASFSTALLRRRAARAGGTVPATSLSINVVRASIFGLGGLLVLSNLGISITPLLTALGVGSLAVALALQPTLTNFIAGVHISVARPFRVGDYVQLEPEQAALVQVGVAYGSDMQRVEGVTCEVARDTLRSVHGGVGSFEPFIRYHTFGDSSINFTVILRVKEFTDRYLVTHEFMKRLKSRYEEEGIEIPFPQRVVHSPVRSDALPAAGPVRLAGGEGGGR